MERNPMRASVFQSNRSVRGSAALLLSLGVAAISIAATAALFRFQSLKNQGQISSLNEDMSFYSEIDLGDTLTLYGLSHPSGTQGALATSSATASMPVSYNAYLLNRQPTSYNGL